MPLEQKESKRKFICDPIDFSDLGLVLGLAYSSRNLRTITVERDGKPRVMNRAYIHAYIQAPKGNFKSTHARALVDLHPQEIVIQDNITHAGLVGSVDDKGQFIPPDLIRWAGKVVIMDEVVKDRHGEFTRALLKLMEENMYVRKIARAIRGEDRSKDEAWKAAHNGAWYRVDDGLLEVYAPFTLIMLSMVPLTITASSQIGGAMLDRMFAVTYKVSPEQQDAMVRGMFDITIPEWNPPSNSTVKLEDFHEIMKWWNALIPADPNSVTFGSRARVLDNMIRAFVITGKHDPHIYELMTKVASGRWEDVK